MMPKVPKAYGRVLDEHRARLLRVTEKQGLKQMRKTYEQAIAELEAKLKRLPGGKRDTFAAHQYRTTLGQLRQGMKVLTRRMSGALGDIGRGAQTEALRGLIGDITKLEKAFTGAEIVVPVEEAAAFQRVIRKAGKPMMRAHKETAANLGARLIGNIEKQLSLSLAMGEDMGGMIDRVDRTLGQGWYQAERIARTESIWAFNATQAVGMEEVAEELDDLMMRWVENVGDDYRPLDDRVSLDSIAMHGQVTKPGSVFRFPRSLPSGAPTTSRRPGRNKVETWPEVLSRFRGQSWSAPPNRPLDRASIQPWRPHWGIPAWRWVGGRRVEM